MRAEMVKEGLAALAVPLDEVNIIRMVIMVVTGLDQSMVQNTVIKITTVTFMIIYLVNKSQPSSSPSLPTSPSPLSSPRLAGWNG